MLFFLAHASRRVWFARCTKNPTGDWITQQARNLGLDFADQGIRFLIGDRDSTYSGPFNQVFHSERIRIVKTPGARPRERTPSRSASSEPSPRSVSTAC